MILKCLPTSPEFLVSSSCYPERDGAPTWNYAAVPCHGHLDLFSRRPTYALDRASFARAEGKGPAQFPESFLNWEASLIVGFEIALERIEAWFQMSQYERPGDT